jgi:hypothetical protein
MTGHTVVLPDASEVRARLLAAESIWLRTLAVCSCSRPVRDRVYGSRWSCRRCGKLTGLRALRTRVVKP